MNSFEEGSRFRGPSFLPEAQSAFLTGMLPRAFMALTLELLDRSPSATDRSG